jgi:hypothetical protein
MTQNGLWTSADEFRECVKAWAKKIGVQPRVVTLRPMKRKWGSCSTEGRLTFNTDLLNESREFGEYVIVEELLHLRVPNHGKLFRALLTAYVPNWERISPQRNRTASSLQGF